MPGAWLALGLRLRHFGFGTRLLTGVALSPVVLCAQFYTLRLAGVSFETTAALLPWMNLPAAYWVVKRFERNSLPDKKTLLATALILACAILCATTAVAVTAPKDHIHSREAFRRLSREARHRPVVLRPVSRLPPAPRQGAFSVLPTPALALPIRAGPIPTTCGTGGRSRGSL